MAILEQAVDNSFGEDRIRLEVSSVLAWNRALRLETCGKFDLARAMVVDELSWLLTKHVFKPTGVGKNVSIVIGSARKAKK